MKLLSSLTNRIFLATALLAVLSIGVATYVVNVAMTRQAEDELRRGLEEAAELVAHYRNLLFEHFTREAMLVADLPKLKAAVFEDHPPTVRPIAEGYRQQIDSALFLVTNARGRVLAQIGVSDLTAGQMASLPALQNALAGRVATTFWPQAGAVLQIVSVPIWIDPSQPELLGTLSVGFSLDQQMAERFKRLTDSEIAFTVDGRVRASTLPDLEEPVLSKLLEAKGVVSMRLRSEEYVAVARSLAPERGSGGAATENNAGVPRTAVNMPVALILRSRTERLRFLRAVQTALAVMAVVALLAATLLSYAVARTVTRPLETITATMRDMAATGDLTRRIELARGRYGDDEDARLLANTFNTMTESIARFQREMAQRERLASLGRLSTIVAHEIRNPLMIIRASLRSLRREQGSPDQIRAAIADIDEEVTRLNRLVSEVLDFARPIRFEHGPTDLNALCADAATATAAGNDEPRIRLTVDPAAATIVTDHERLRLALVNILTNARDAVLAVAAASERPGRGDGGPTSAVAPPGEGHARIELVTTALEDGRVAVVVRDRGIGIRPEDLSNVFDPYFTTKRTGSGLGLAIARNIVEGLGGTISASSRPGGGTEIRITLPRAPVNTVAGSEARMSVADGPSRAPEHLRT